MIRGIVYLLVIVGATGVPTFAYGQAPSVTAGECAGDAREESAAERGYRWLTTKSYLPADFDQDTFDSVWKFWPQPWRDQARGADAAGRRRLAFSRYGLMERPGNNTATGTALGYVDDGQGGWVMNCLACHTGKVAGKVILGAPNSHFALQTLTEDVRLTKIQQGKKLSHLDLASIKIPLGDTHGTTNAVVFGVALGALRDKDLNFRRDLPPPALQHHDMDAPPWWNVRKKKRIYADGFAARSHRPLLQFVMLPRNSAETLKSWEPDYQDILAWIESLPVPRYPGPVVGGLAQRGRVAFERVCASCHGTYGENPTYPDVVVPLAEVGTDAMRLHSLTAEYRKSMQDGWYGNYGQDSYLTDPGGYLAPPLDGIWASAPYLHNGSVPTLWHLLHPESRPTVWQRTEDGYDHEHVGLEVQTYDALPPQVKTAVQKRSWFDTSRPGKSSAGHLFPNALTEEEKRAVLEYLKSL